MENIYNKNSVILLKILQKEIYEKHIKHIRKKPENIKQLISIIVEIIVSNIRTIQIGVVILSKLLEFLSETEEDEKIIDKIISKIQKIPNADFLNIWLQRLSYPINKNKKFETILCRKVINDEVNLFNSGWITMKNKFKEEDIIDKSKLKSISRVIPEEEALIYYYVE